MSHGERHPLLFPGLIAIIAVVAALTRPVAAANASRPPTKAELPTLYAIAVQDIAKSSPSLPIGCLALRFRVSTVDPRYALRLDPFVHKTPNCLRYVGNGQDMLFRGVTGWRFVYRGSDPPACSRFPVKVLRDLWGGCLSSG